MELTTIQSGKYIHSYCDYDPLTCILQERDIIARNKEQALKMMKLAELAPNSYSINEQRKFARSYQINEENLERLDSHLDALVDNGYLKKVDDKEPRGDWVNGEWVEDINGIYGEEVA